MSIARIGVIGVGWWGTVGHLEPLSKMTTRKSWPSIAAQEPRQRSTQSATRSQVDIFAAVPRNFVRTLLGEEELHVSTEVAVNAVKVLDAAYRSADTGQSVAIS